MNLKSYVTTIVIVVLMFSCQTSKKPLVDNNMVFITNQHTVSVLPTTAYDSESIITQIITGQYSGHEYIMQTFLSITPYEVSVTAMTQLGNTVYDLTYNQDGIEYNALMDIGGDGSAYMILDIQLCYYPLDVVKSLIEDSGLTFVSELTDSGWKREVVNKGDVILTIVRDGNTLNYTNNLRNYSYVIEEME